METTVATKKTILNEHLKESESFTITAHSVVLDEEKWERAKIRLRRKLNSFICYCFIKRRIKQNKQWSKSNFKLNYKVPSYY